MTDSAKSNVITVINSMLNLCEPIKYDEFNKFLPAKDDEKLLDIESIIPKIGIATMENKNNNNKKWGITTLGIIATITDILSNSRLSFQIDENDFIVGVQWYEDGAANTDGTRA